MIPQQPLQEGFSYTASITTNGQTYTWNFTTIPDPVNVPANTSTTISQ